MSLNGIDISNWQAGINLAAVPADFVIIKATEGNRYISPDWVRQYQQTKGSGKLLGLYHFANGGNVQSGDTLSGIAAKHGTSCQALVQMNGISNLNLIYAKKMADIPELKPIPGCRFCR